MVSKSQQAVGRVLLTAASALAFATAASPAIAQSGQAQTIEVSAQPLKDTLLELGRRYGVSIIADGALVRGKSAPRIRGALTVDQALNRALAGSGLTFAKRNGGRYVISRAAAPIQSSPSSRDDNAEGAPQDELSRVADTEQAIVVTGSRIERTAVNSPAPIDVVTSEEIEAFGFNEATEALRFVPALNSSISLTSQEGPSGTAARPLYGLATLNLRNLGANRTLVLVNGRRHVSGVANAATVDVSSIPDALIDRVEVLTGGGSSIYGADAVSGVVNYILKDDFEGVDFRVVGTLPTRGGGEAFSGSVTMGGNFADGRGNAVLNAQYNRQTELRANEREASRVSSFVVPNNAALSEALGVDAEFKNVLVPDRRFAPFVPGPLFSLTSSSLLSPFPTVGQNLPQIGGIPLQQIRDPETGEIRSLTPVAFVSGFDTQGGDSLNGLFSNPLTTTVPDIERISVNMIADYDFTDRVTGFLEAKYSRNEAKARSTSAPTVADLAIGLDSPFIPQVVQSQLDSLGAQGIEPNLNVTRTFFDDIASQPSDNIRQTFRIVGGLKGDISDALSYEVFANYGRTDTSLSDPSEPLLDRLYAAADAVADPATGQPICRSDLDPDAFPPTSFLAPLAAPGFRSFVPGDGSCAPINLFAPFNELDPDAVNFIFQGATDEFEIEQFVVNANITGNSADWLSLPAGGIGYAIGIEYREERSESRPDAIKRNRLGRLQNNPFDIVGGEFDVIEGFAEVNIPILAELQFAESLAFDASVRIADYSTVGTATSFAVGGVWQPIDDLRIRASFNRAVRAPNIAELFAPQATRLTNLPFVNSDPCDPNNTAQGSPTREQNCAQLIPDLATFDPSASYLAGNVAATSGGNPDLIEETADTYTIGFAYTPGFLPGFSIVADYYDIQIDDAISSGINRLVIVENCADAPTIENPFCAAVTRNPVTGAVETIQQTNLNFSAANARGIDYQIAYTFDLDDVFGGELGQFSANVSGTYLIERVDQQFAGFPGSDIRIDGSLNVPEHFINFAINWNKGPWSADYGFNFQSSQTFGGPAEPFGIQEIEEDPFLLDRPETGSAFVHYLGGAYEFDERFQLSFRVNNLFDRDPFELRGFGNAARPVNFLGRTVQIGFRGGF